MITSELRDRLSSMYCVGQSRPLLSLCALVMLLVAGCTNTKVSQCRRLMLAIDKGNILLNSFAIDPASGGQLADALDATIAQFNQVKFTDETIVGFQTRAIAIQEQISHAFRDTSSVVNLVSDVQPTPDGLQTVKAAKAHVDGAIASVEQAAEKADALSGDIERYCTDSTP